MMQGVSGGWGQVRGNDGGAWGVSGAWSQVWGAISGAGGESGGWNHAGEGNQGGWGNKQRLRLGRGGDRGAISFMK